MIKESDIFNNILIINVKLHYCPIEKSFLKCSVDFFPFSALLFLSFFGVRIILLEQIRF